MIDFDKVRTNFIISLNVSALQFIAEDSPTKTAIEQIELLEEFEARIRQDQKEKCVAAVQDDIKDELFIIQRIMEAD